ncbi:MAG: type 4a pilus biogenesis protein PilO [Candidatus Kaiserbacteria bacterium]|nr:MAG: type 4a pilus biogenesis protein PilO [Candidatus Kaiserbacteria bacterium]
MVKLILSIVGLGLSGVIFFLYTQPAYEGVRSVRATIGQYDQALTKATELQQLKQTLLSRYNTFNQSDIDRLHKLLPDHVDNVRLVLDLDSLAGRHGMALQNVVISNPASEELDPGVIAAIGASGARYDSLTLKFSTIGSYEDFLGFLQDLETSLRVVDLVSLNITRDSLSSDLSPRYRYDITIRTYWLK